MELLVRSISVRSDSRVACEATLENEIHHPFSGDSDSDPDFPPESYSIQIRDDIHHWDQINPVYDPEESTRGTTNPKSHISCSNNHHLIISSKRFSGNLKATTNAPIIALPHKLHHHHNSGHLSRSSRKVRSARAFVSKGGSIARPLEPGSPEVSCLGKVLSRREQRSPENGRRGQSSEVSCFARVFSCFVQQAPTEEKAISEENIPSIERNIPAVGEEERPGLGGMRRFVSGRRPRSWGDDIAVYLA